ncbi:MAG: hypothetical protein GKR94_32820 [Gammaproteobacteria bacterium]|nr:hypothetical protein [Gammaproteobacteria bacterium]
MDREFWVQCDSKSDMQARLDSSECGVFDELITDEANTWGYLRLKEEGICIPIGFADVGLLPEVLLHNRMVYVGITDTVAGYEVATGNLVFKYRVPTVFHEFVASEREGIIVQDETGFIGLSGDGDQIWMNMCSDTIETYRISGSVIVGRTADGDNFKFPIA